MGTGPYAVRWGTGPYMVRWGWPYAVRWGQGYVVRWGQGRTLDRQRYPALGYHRTPHGRMCVNEHLFNSNNFVMSADLVEECSLLVEECSLLVKNKLSEVT